MRLIILITLFLIPLIGFASFPIYNDITEITNQIPKKLWYNTWWAILLNILFLIPLRSFILLNLIGYTGLSLRIYQNKKLWKLLLLIGAVVGTIGFIVVVSYLSQL
tara:strand:- start:933 stop:1250 length:318 start_codon:yes stop_codon:yes gene_type:complete